MSGVLKGQMGADKYITLRCPILQKHWPHSLNEKELSCLHPSNSPRWFDSLSLTFFDGFFLALEIKVPWIKVPWTDTGLPLVCLGLNLNLEWRDQWKPRWPSLSCLVGLNSHCERSLRDGFSQHVCDLGLGLKCSLIVHQLLCVRPSD